MHAVATGRARRFDPAFVAAAADAEPGDVVGPVQTAVGWHVIAGPAVRRGRRLGHRAVRSSTAGAAAVRRATSATPTSTSIPRYGRWDAAPPCTVVALLTRAP